MPEPTGTMTSAGTMYEREFWAIGRHEQMKLAVRRLAELLSATWR